MSRIWFSICTLAAGLSATSAPAAERPDILMIAVDDLRPMLGCYGAEQMKTPHIDRLASQSIVFERAYCQYAKCGTSRLSLMTGLRPDSIGVFSNSFADVRAFRKRRPDALSMSNWFKRHGYHALAFGKINHDGWHVDDDWSSPPSIGRSREMWEVVDADDPSQPTLIAKRLACPAIQSPDVPDTHLFAGRMTQEVITSLRQRDEDRPMFLAVGYRRPHLPLVAPKRYFDLYRPDEAWLAKHRLPAENAPIMAWFNSDAYVGTARGVGLTMPHRPNRQQAVDWNGYELRSYLGIPNRGAIDEPTQLRVLQAYAACVSYVDSQIGLILDELRRQRRLEQTVIVLWSDHGWHLGEHSAWGKMSNYEIATRVPLIISVPGVSAGRTRTLAELVDLYPTLCEVAGLPLPKQLEGESLVPTIKKPAEASEAVAHSQYSRFGGKFMGRAIRSDRFRYVQWVETNSGKTVHRELYDHHADPHETNNLAGDSQQATRMEEFAKLLGTSSRKKD